MIERILLGGASDTWTALARSRLACAFRGTPVLMAGALAAAPRLPRRERIEVDLGEWLEPGYDPLRLDWSLDPRVWDEPHELALTPPAGADPGEAELAATQVLIRLQRLIDRRNAASRTALFRRALARHRGLFDLSLPLVRADYEHAVDTWRWLLRLAPLASLPAQLAALFHDVERLRSEALERREQHATDYAAYKANHARGGVELTREALGTIGLPPADLEVVLRLVSEHERPPSAPEEDPVLGALNEADALSYFSLNASGFLACYGPAHTRKKIRYTLARLGPAARLQLDRLRYSAPFEALLRDELAAGGAAAQDAALETPDDDAAAREAA